MQPTTQYPAYVNRHGETQSGAQAPIPFRALVRAEKQRQSAPQADEKTHHRPGAAPKRHPGHTEPDYMRRPWYRRTDAEKADTLRYNAEIRKQEESEMLLKHKAELEMDPKEKAYDIEMMETYRKNCIRVKEAISVHEHRIQLDRELNLLDGPAEPDFARPTKEDCEKLLAEGTTMTAHWTSIAEVLLRAAKYEDVRKALPSLEEVALEKWYAGLAPMKAAIIADHAKAETVGMVALWVATVLTPPVESSQPAEIEPLAQRSSQCSPDVPEMPAKWVERKQWVSKDRMKAFRPRATGTGELEGRLVRYAEKRKRGYQPPRIVGEIVSELTRRGVEVFA